MSKKQLENLGAVIFIFIFLGIVASLGTAIALGIVQKSFWAGALTIIAMVITLTGMFAGMSELDEKESVIMQILCIFTGVILFLLANKIVEYQGGWLWTPIWLTIGLIVLYSGLFQWNKGAKVFSIAFFLISISLIAISVAGPITLFSTFHQQLAADGETPTEIAATEPEAETEEPAETALTPTTVTETEAPTNTPADTPTAAETADEGPAGTEPAESPPAEPASTGFTAFVTAALGSPWGWVYLGLIALIGYFAWHKWWGALITLGLTAAAAFLCQWTHPARLQSLTLVFSSNPAEFWQILLTRLAAPSHAAGWTLFLTGLCFSVIFAGFQLAQDAQMDAFGNALYAITLSLPAAALGFLLFRGKTDFPTDGLAFFTSTGWEKMSSWRFYLILLAGLVLAAVLRYMQTKHSRNLFAFLHKIPAGLIGLAVSGVGLLIPTGLFVFLVGALLGVDLRKIALLKEENA
jgi:hypothetical protein